MSLMRWLPGMMGLLLFELQSLTAFRAQGILDDTSDSYLANIASWADDYRSTTAGAFSAAFHYIDAEDDPPATCDVDYDRDCGTAGCSVSAIANYTQRVGDSRLSAANTAIALKFIVHLLGDITQPLHDEAYQVGGNDISVTYQGYTDNLHSDWDSYIPETLVGGYALTDALSWATSLIAEIDSGDYKSAAAGWVEGDTLTDVVTTAMTWATDANAYVCAVVMPNGAAALQTGDLYPTYYDSVVPTIELQVAKGGYRLANWLNLIHTGEVAKKRDAGSASKIPPVDLMGRDFLPAARPMSRAEMARAAVGYNCGHDHKHR